MILSSAVQVIRNAESEMSVIIPASHLESIIVLLVSIVALLLVLCRDGSRKWTVLWVAIVLLFIGQTLRTWNSSTTMTLSRTENTLIITWPGYFHATTRQYSLDSVRSAVVDVGADASKRIDFVLTSGETIYVGNYQQREGFEAAVIAINDLLGVQTPPSNGPHQ